MKLWSGVLSSNAAKVRIVLAEKGVTCDIIEVPWSKATLWDKPESLWSVNPRGQVPALTDGEITLWDSTVINEYLEEKYPQPSLLPDDIAGRARCRLLEDEGDFNQGHVGVLISEVFLAAPGTPVSEEAASALSRLRQFFDRLEGELEGGDYLCGDFSMADISVFLTVAFAVTLGAEITQPRVLAWYERMLARPAVAAEYGAILDAAAAA